MRPIGPLLILLFALPTGGRADCPAFDPAIPAAQLPEESPRCRFWNQEDKVAMVLTTLRTLDQLILGPGRPPGYDLIELSRRVDPDCRVEPQSREDREETAALAELKCNYFKFQLQRYHDCNQRLGLVETAAPNAFDGEHWAGPDRDAWVASFNALSPAGKCVRIRQALAFAIERTSSIRPTFGIHHFGTGDHGLFVGTPPQPGHVRDRREAAWALRFATAVPESQVPESCRAAAQEARFRLIEATNGWKRTYPQVFGAAPNPEPFGRQSLGYAFGMCGRCNNAHYTDSVSRIIDFNAKHPDQAIPLEPEVASFVNGLTKGNGTTYGPWNGAIEWRAFLGEPRPPRRTPSVLDNIGMPRGFDPLGP